MYKNKEIKQFQIRNIRKAVHRKGLSLHPGLQLPLDTRHSTSRYKGRSDPAVDENLPLRARTKIPGPLPKCLAPPSTLSTRGYTLENVAGPSSLI